MENQLRKRSTESWTRIFGFQIQCADHYTFEPTQILWMLTFGELPLLVALSSLFVMITVCSLFGFFLVLFHWLVSFLSRCVKSNLQLENGTRRAQIPRKPLIFPSLNKQTDKQKTAATQGFELSTLAFLVQCSYRLSYRAVHIWLLLSDYYYQITFILDLIKILIQSGSPDNCYQDPTGYPGS